MDFGLLLSRSWNIVWKNKFLFLLGFLAALGGGGGSNSTSSFDSSNFSTTGRDFASEIETFFSTYGALLLGAGCLAVIIGLVLWLVRLTAQGSLIASVVSLDAGESVTLGQAFSAGLGKLKRLVGLNVVMYGPFALAGFIVGAIFFVTAGAAVLTELSGGSATDVEAVFGSLGILAICFGCLGCLLVPLLVLVTAVYPFAQRGAVIQDMGVIESIRHGWQVVRTNLSDIILLVVLFAVLSFLFGFVVIIVMIPFALISIGPILFNAIQEQSFTAMNIVWLIGASLCTGLVGAAVNSIMVTFRSTAVTLAYQGFTQKDAPDSMKMDDADLL